MLLDEELHLFVCFKNLILKKTMQTILAILAILAMLTE